MKQFKSTSTRSKLFWLPHKSSGLRRLLSDTGSWKRLQVCWCGLSEGVDNLEGKFNSLKDCSNIFANLQSDISQSQRQLLWNATLLTLFCSSGPFSPASILSERVSINLFAQQFLSRTCSLWRHLQIRGPAEQRPLFLLSRSPHADPDLLMYLSFVTAAPSVFFCAGDAVCVHGCKSSEL